MPNYSLVMNSKFQPFSFERYIQPLQIYGQAYREQEDALAELDTKASIWEGMANEQTDPIAHAQYKKYADDLKAQATLIATEGLNPSSRQAMLNLRGRYAKEIVPIEQAYQRRAEQIAEQRKAGNQMIHSYDASTTSLDEFLGNPSLSYKSINRADLLKESTGLMSQFATELRDFRIDGNLDKFHKKLIQNYGLTKEEANTFATAIASGQIDNNNAVQALAQRIYNSTGVADWNNADASNRVWQTIAEGVTAGIGKQGATVIADEQAKLNAQYAKELALMREKAKLEEEKAAREAAAKAKKDKTNSYSPRYNTRNVYSQHEVEERASDWADYGKYFRFDKQKNIWVMTEEGKKQRLTISTPPPVGGGGPKPTPFARFLDKYGLREAYNGRSGPYQSKIIASLAGDYEGSYDATRSTEYQRVIDPSQHDNILSILNTVASDDGEIPNYIMTGESGNYKLSRNKKGVNISELKSSDILSAEIRYGLHGNYLRARTKDNTIMIPYNALVSNTALINTSEEAIRRYREAINQSAATGNEQLAYFLDDDNVVRHKNDAIISELNAIGDNMMSGLGVYQTEPDKVKQGEYQ